MAGCINDSSNKLPESTCPDACKGIGYAALIVLKSAGLITVAVVATALVLGIITINVGGLVGACMYSPISLLGVIPMIAFDLPIVYAIGKVGIEIVLGLGSWISSDCMRAGHYFTSVNITEDTGPRPWV